MNGQGLPGCILVMADDFTGANDAGVSLAQGGITVDVMLRSSYQRDGRATALVLNSDSRALPQNAAGERISSLMHSALKQQTPAWMIKKIDSTLRGNPGAETEAMMTATGATVALVAPAFPAAGRLTRNGECLVHGQRLTDTEFASDPKTPVLSADVREVFQLQSRMAALYVDLTTLRAGDLPALIAGYPTPLMVMIDSETDADLDAVIDAARQLSTPPLLVGSAGLCDALARHLAPVRRKRVLAVVGSMSEMAQKQIHHLHQHPEVSQVFINIDDVFTGDAQNYRMAISEALSSGRHCLVHTCPDHAARHQITALCEKWQISRSELGEKISAFLGELTREVINQSEPDALYLSGGDVAIAVSRALGASGFRITGRVAQCVPYGNFLGCGWHKPVMTKAGGFGDETTLLRVLHFIEENASV